MAWVAFRAPCRQMPGAATPARWALVQERQRRRCRHAAGTRRAHGGCGRARRCSSSAMSRIASSSRLDLASQAPCARPMLLPGQAPRTYPALDIPCEDPDLLLALVDDFGPTAVEERAGAVRVFFASSADRDAACLSLASRFAATTLDVSDEDWASRSQASLQPITIGQLTVFPNPESRT